MSDLEHYRRAVLRALYELARAMGYDEEAARRQALTDLADIWLEEKSAGIAKRI